MLKKMSLLILSGWLIAALTACNDDGPFVNLVGVDNEGKEIQIKVSESKFNDRFSDILNSASITSINTLQNDQNANQAKWGLSEVEVGIDLELSGGVTAIVGLGVGSGASVTLSKEGAAATGESHE